MKKLLSAVLTGFALVGAANAGVVRYVVNASPKKVATDATAPVRHPKKTASNVKSGVKSSAVGVGKGVKATAVGVSKFVF